MLEKVNVKDSFGYYLKLGSTIGYSKNAKWVIQVGYYRYRHINIHNVTFFGGSVTRSRSNMTCTRFFLSVKRGKTENFLDHFHNKPLGPNFCSKIVK